MSLLEMLKRGIRPSATQSTAALWAKSLLNAVLFFAIFMWALPFTARWLVPGTAPFPAGLGSWLGGFLFFAGLAVWIACLDQFSRRGRGTPLPMDAPRRLVTQGPFAFVRNPIMAAELAVIWGEAIFLANLGVLIYALAISILAHLMVVRVEEPELRERFGDDYDLYCRRVPRWFPISIRRRSGSS